jgi:hypothetical protein
MIADDLYEAINDEYPGRYVKISVAEDNENGCEMEYHLDDLDDGPNFDVEESDIVDVFDSLK